MTIGSNVVISIGSLVNRDVPDGALVGGIPAKVLRENAYPKALDTTKKDAIVRKILTDYIPLLRFKGYATESAQNVGNVWSLSIDDTHQIMYGEEAASLLPLVDPKRRVLMLYFTATKGIEGTVTHFNLSTLCIDGDMDELGEDLRDYLRRRGIKFYTGQKFTSIVPPDFRRWM